MPRCPALALSICLLGVLPACAPTFNWRDTTIGATTLTALFPCKPETVTRTVPIAHAQREVTMRSCDSDGVTFAVAHTVLSDPAQVPSVLADWRASTLAGLRVDPAQVTSEPPEGLPMLPQALVLRANRAATGPQAPQLLGVWFAQGSDVFAAFVLAPSIPAEVIEPFFAGLRLR